MEKTLSLGAFTELEEKEAMEVDGGCWWLVAVGLGILAVAGVAVVAVSVGNHNNRVTAQKEANETGSPVVADQWFKDDVTMYPKKDLLDQALSY